MFAVQQAGICPDIVCIGKALTGGCLTLAATAVRDEIYNAFHTDEAIDALMHGPTYMANPLACAAANASLDLFDREPRMEEIANIAEKFAMAATQLSSLPAVKGAESLGAILVVRFDQDLPRDCTNQWFIERGIWLRPIRNVIYACPPVHHHGRPPGATVKCATRILRNRFHLKRLVVAIGHRFSRQPSHTHRPTDL